MEEEYRFILDNMFKKYENKYSEIFDTLKIETKVWATSPYYNLYPLEIELSGYKKGKLYKSEPKIKKNVVVYGFINNELCYTGIYDDFSLIFLEYFFINKENDVIVLGFYKKKLDRVYITNLNSNNENQYTFLMFMDNVKRYTKNTYEYNNGKISKVIENGVRVKEQNIAIIDVIYNVTYDIDSVKEIIATQNNHKTGLVNTLKIYPRR